MDASMVDLLASQAASDLAATTAAWMDGRWVGSMAVQSADDLAVSMDVPSAASSVVSSADCSAGCSTA